MGLVPGGTTQKIDHFIKSAQPDRAFHHAAAQYSTHPGQLPLCQRCKKWPIAMNFFSTYPEFDGIYRHFKKVGTVCALKAPYQLNFSFRIRI